MQRPVFYITSEGDLIYRIINTLNVVRESLRESSSSQVDASLAVPMNLSLIWVFLELCVCCISPLVLQEQILRVCTSHSFQGHPTVSLSTELISVNPVAQTIIMDWYPQTFTNCECPSASELAVDIHMSR